MKNPLVMTAIAVALLAGPAQAGMPAMNTTPPGTCSVEYTQTAIPGYPNESAYGVILSIKPGRDTNTHKHDAVEYLTVLHGAGTLVIGNAMTPLVVGKTVMIPMNVEHRIDNASRTAPLVFEGFMIGSNAKSVRYKMTEGEKSYTPGCPH